MSEKPDYSFLLSLLKRYYGVEVVGLPVLLNEREGQRVFRVDLPDGMGWTVRLCPASRPAERVLADTEMLTYLTQRAFPAPRLVPTADGSSVFEWKPGIWGYVSEFIVGQQPAMDLATLSEVGTMLGGLSLLADDPQAFSVKVDWLDELPIAIRRALDAQADPVWGRAAHEIADILVGLPMLELRMLPLGMLHTDVHEGNLLRDSTGKLYLLDWESSGVGEAILDLALVLAWHCVWLNPAHSPDLYDFDEVYCRAVLRAYQTQRPLSPSERRLLGPAIQYVIGWYATRDIELERATPGVTDGLASLHWQIVRSVTPQWAATLEQWATQTAG